MINWKVRIKHKYFWMAIIPAILLVIETIAEALGYPIDLGDLGNKLLAIVNAVFELLAILGIVVDHTTEGIGDSSLAMTYEEPKRKA